MALRIKLPPATRPPIRFEPIIKPEIPAELLRRGSTPPMPMVTPTPVAAPLTMPTPRVMPVPAKLPVSLPQMAPVAQMATVATVAGVPAPVPPVPLTARNLFTDRASAAPFPAPVAALNAQPVAALPVAAPTETAAEPAPLEEPPVSEAILQRSSAPAMIRASSLIFKWGMLASVLLGIGFLAIKFLVPVLDELQNPGRTDAITDKDAPTAVRLLQQTRQVVAKNDSNVHYLNSVVDAANGIEPAKVTSAKVAPAVPVVAPKAPAPRVASDLSPFQEAVSRLTIGGVFDGPEPRAYLDGRLVKYGEIINRNLGLRFVGVDPDQHAVLFTNADNVTFRKHF